MRRQAPPGYYDHERPEVAARIPPHGSRILDLGCGSGALGALLKQQGAREVVGIELDEEAAGRARQRLDEVIVTDLDRLDALPFSPATFDVAICADVLEHLADPWHTLAMVANVLVPGGLLVASIPNIRHESVVLGLLAEGRFGYDDEGILDRTHLRFFTLTGVRALIEGAGFEIVGPIGAVRTSPSAYLEVTADLVARLGHDPDRFRDEATVVQFLVTARRMAPHG